MLKYATAPEGALDVVTEVLAGMHPEGLHGQHVLSFDLETLHVGHPLPNYRVSMREIAQGRLTAEVELTRWDVLLFKGDEPHATLFLAPDADGNLEWAGMNDCGYPAHVVEALVLAESMASRVDYEPRILATPGIHSAVLWLSGLGVVNKLLPVPVPDMFIPVTVPDMKAAQDAFNLAGMVERLGTLAKRRILNPMLEELEIPLP